MTERPCVAIYGGGPAGMMAAWALASHFEVHLYEKGKALGRKFLVAGKGGFNLSHHAEIGDLFLKYQPQSLMQPCLAAFGSKEVRQWLEDLGIPTFVGSSGRIFPERGIKPVEVLRAIEQSLVQKGVQIHLHHAFAGFNAQRQPLLQHQGRTWPSLAHTHVFALGGASWAKTGSDGEWLRHFANLGIPTQPFQASNCGLEVDWPPGFIPQFAGRPLKNVRFSLAGFSIRGEAVITEYGLEGNAIYPLSAQVRAAWGIQPVHIILDSKPMMDKVTLVGKMAGRQITSRQYARIFKLDKAILAIIKQFSSKEAYTDARHFIQWIKECPIPIKGFRPMDEAISTVGGIAASAVDEHFRIKGESNMYCIGEMLDWDAPTGGFLLQGCFSSGYFAAMGILGPDRALRP